jgi:hypothetical protein
MSRSVHLLEVLWRRQVCNQTRALGLPREYAEGKLAAWHLIGGECVSERTKRLAGVKPPGFDEIGADRAPNRFTHFR